MSKPVHLAQVLSLGHSIAVVSASNRLTERIERPIVQAPPVQRNGTMTAHLQKFINIVCSQHHTDLSGIRSGRRRYNLCPAREKIVRRLHDEGWPDDQIADFMHAEPEKVHAIITLTGGRKEP